MVLISMQISWRSSSVYVYIFPIITYCCFYPFSIGGKHILAGIFLSLGIFPDEYGQYP
jgi:hypothetical protein